MLEDVGLSTFETLGSIQGEPFRLGSPELVVIAEKNG
jgi:hypothetical protein